MSRSPAPADDVHVDAGSLSTTIAAASGGNFESLAVNPAAATTTISDTLDVTTVSLTATPSVAEGGSIVYTASLNNSAQTPVSVTLSNGAVISIAAGASFRQRQRCRTERRCVPRRRFGLGHDCVGLWRQLREPGDQPGCRDDHDHRHD